MKIKRRNRALGSGSSPFQVSVDGVDFSIQEPASLSPRWHSRKVNGAGLRHEIGVSVARGGIVWTHGPFPCGLHSDLTIFRMGMKSALGEEERVVVDDGYRNEQCFLNPDGVLSATRRQRIRARHESVNNRLKQFSALGSTFRHNISLHSICFHAAANLTQLTLRNGNPLFEV